MVSDVKLEKLIHHSQVKFHPHSFADRDSSFAEVCEQLKTDCFLPGLLLPANDFTLHQLSEPFIGNMLGV